MKISLKLLPLVLPVWVSVCFSQSMLERYSDLGDMYVPQLKSAPFPHADRSNGHKYHEEVFPFSDHYNDSSVAIFIPKGYRKTDKTDIVVYFHGWRNNIDIACAQFDLIEQFYASRKNAIFVFPEGPRNVPDSHGGKLEEQDGLKHLINDVLDYLIANSKLNSENVGNIILAGHSGAYRVIAFCLQHGGLTNHVTDVILFDALYGKTEAYLDWIKNSGGRFVDIYTNDGGTREESENLMKTLDSLKIKYYQTEELNLKTKRLSKSRLIFIHTDLTHNEVISVRRQFQSYLATSRLKPIVE